MLTNADQGRSDGGYRDIYPQKSAKVNFLWGKNDIRTAIQQFYTPQKQIYGYAPDADKEIIIAASRAVSPNWPKIESGRPMVIPHLP